MGHLGAKLAQLGVNLNQLEPTWGQLVPTWPQEDILWVHFGPNLSTWAPKWLQDGGPRGVREPTFWMLCWLLGPKWAKMAPRAHQEATRDPKRPPRPPKTMIFEGFGDLFWWIFIVFAHGFSLDFEYTNHSQPLKYYYPPTQLRQ